jgi:septum formation protein
MRDDAAIILASRSARRRDLLRQLGVRFVVIPPSATETADDELPPGERVVKVAFAKAEGVSQVFPERIVLAADTIVVLGNRVFGKPAGPDDAREMLRTLGGRVHQVYSGVVVIRCEDRLRMSGAASTKVKLRRLGSEDIERYLSTGEPFDKAGAYAIQGRGAVLVEWIAGDYSNVVGLPLGLVSDLLRQAGLDVCGGGP